MLATMPTASRAEDATVVARAEEAAAAAADHLALPFPDLLRSPLGPQLADLSQLLEERISLYEPTDVAVASVEHLISILTVRCELLDDGLSRRVRSLSEIRAALAKLRGFPPRDMIHAAPGVLSRELAFTRTMISNVRGSLWVPQYLHTEDDKTDPRSRHLRE